MSYILDALKKKEQDREIGHIPTVETQQEVRWPQRDNRTLVLWLTIILLLALVAFLTGFLWSRLEMPVQASQPVNAAAPEMKNTAPAPAAVVKPVKQFSPPTQAAPLTPVVEKPALLPAPQPAVHKAPEPAAVQELAPLLENLSYVDRDGLPPLSLDVHVYAEQPERRFVLLNLKKMREGDKLDNIFLESITPSGVVLSHNGVRFRVQRQ